MKTIRPQPARLALALLTAASLSTASAQSPSTPPTAPSTTPPAASANPSSPATPSVSAAAPVAEAQALIQAQHFPAAIAILEPLTVAQPENALAWQTLGLAHHLGQEYDAAVSAYEQALVLAPNNPVVLYNLGCVHALRGEADQALAFLARAKATGQMDMAQIASDTDLVSLRADARFAALLPSPADFADPFVEPTTIVREWDGEAANDQFGWIARAIGDVDGDGVTDVVTSAPTKDVGGAGAGRVYVYSTKSGALLWSAEGAPGDQLGTGLEAACDTDGDGVPDVIAGAPGGQYARLYSGRDGRVLRTLHGQPGDPDFGASASGVGDVDRDGCADVIVGTPGAAGANADATAGPAKAGRADVFSGKDGHVLLTLTGSGENDALGSIVAGFADDTHILLVVGAPGAGSAHHGQALVYTALSARPAFTIDADDSGVALGAMFVSVLGDVDGDRVPDVYASDWSDAARGPSTGRVYVHSGSDGRRLFTLAGETGGEGFGTSPSPAGDVDGDGHADLCVGAWQHSSGAASGGRVSLHSGKDGRLLKTFTDRIPGDTLGFDAVGLGDVDGDGTVDLLLTAAWSGIHGFHSGRAFIVSSGVQRATSH